MSEKYPSAETTNVSLIVGDCRELLAAYRSGLLGDCELPEDSSPEFGEDQKETRLAYFTLPMSLNYRRNSSQLWSSALRTFEDSETTDVYSASAAAQMPQVELAEKLARYKVVLQPTRHTLNWSTISQTVATEWGSFTGLLEASNYDFLQLKGIVQQTHKKGFPYLAGPKLFNYWCHILNSRCNVDLQNKEFVDIAVDTHVTKGSVALGVINEDESAKMSAVEIAAKWREALNGSGIAPVDMNEALWFWSRNGFGYELQR